MVFMSIEMTIYVAYYKDVVFAIMNVFISIGIYFSKYKDSYSDDGRIGYTNGALFFVGITFLFVTLLHSFQSAFYLKYETYVKKLKELQGRNRARDDAPSRLFELNRPFIVSSFNLSQGPEGDFFKETSSRDASSAATSNSNLKGSYFD